MTKNGVYRYNYEEGKIRVEDILDGKNDNKEVKILPPRDKFTFINGYYSRITAIFVDIRDSTSLFAGFSSRRSTVAKIIRSFTSEIIEIFRNDKNIREIGIRGDCVYAVYSAPTRKENLRIFDKAIEVNTFINMLNKLLKERDLDPIKMGIGISASQELVVKAGRRGSDMNQLVWIGKAVTRASKFSGLANKGKYINKTLMMSENFYNYIFGIANDKKSRKKTDPRFLKYTDEEFGTFYTAYLVDEEFNNWIKEGMK